MSVTSVGTNAFQGDGVSSVSIPNSVVSIGAAAFSECPITSFITPTNLTSIEDAVFDDCSHLTNIVFPDNVTNIGNEAFFMCSGLTSVIIPGKVTTIGEAAFFGCDSLTNIVIPASVSAIGNGAFSTCAFAGVTIPGSVTNLQGGTFSYCYELTNVTFLHSVYNIGDGAFYDCSGLTAVNFTGNAPSVASSFAFFGAPATVYYLPGTSGWDSFATNADVPIAPLAPSLSVDFEFRTNLRRSVEPIRFHHLLGDECIRHRGRHDQPFPARLAARSDQCPHQRLSLFQRSELDQLSGPLLSPAPCGLSFLSGHRFKNSPVPSWPFRYDFPAGRPGIKR